MLWSTVTIAVTIVESTVVTTIVASCDATVIAVMATCSNCISNSR